jgi:arginine decarboxylase
MFEDTPEFVARHIIREAKSYLDGLAPPFFRALVDYANDGSYSWHCPGHSGGVAFLKSPVGQMFHQFFGENMLRADVCNAVEELGQLLDHTGPVAARNAMRRASSMPTTATSSPTALDPTRWSGTRPWRRRHRGGGPQLPQVHPALDHHDRRDSGVPDAHAQPPRHHRPDPLEEFTLESIQKRSKPTLRPRSQEQEAAHPDHHAVDLRRRALQRRNHAEMLDGQIDTLHFDEAWLPHATFHDFYKDMHAIGKDRRAPRSR